MSNPKRPVSTVEEFIKVFHEMSARYGRSELWYDYIDIDNHLFRKHRCYAACGEDYSCEAGDYYPIMNFIRDAGEQLLIQDLENFDVKVMELASDDEVADFYCEHPHELFRAAYIKVSEKDTIGKCYSRLYVFCSGHEETFSDGSSFPVCDSHYVMVVKEGKKSSMNTTMILTMLWMLCIPSKLTVISTGTTGVLPPIKT